MNDEARVWPLAEEPIPVRLMSTVWGDTDGIHDDLDSPSGLDAWMDAIGADRGGATATAQDLVEAQALRDSLRRLAAYQTDDKRPAAESPMKDPHRAVDVLNTAAARLPAPQLRIDDDTFRRAHTPTSAGPAALAEVASQAIELFGGPDAVKLRACQAPGCILYFVKSHPRREWCSIACGNRARAARHYRRIRRPSSPPPD